MGSTPYSGTTFVLQSSDPNNLIVKVSRNAYILDAAYLIASTNSGKKTSSLKIQVESCGKETIRNATIAGVEITKILLPTAEKGIKFLLDQDLFQSYFSSSSEKRCPISSFALTSNTDGSALSKIAQEYVEMIYDD